MLAVLGTPNAFHAQIMEAAGCEAAFVGTGITGGNYTALPDTGVLFATECVQFGGYIARAVSFPVILDRKSTRLNSSHIQKSRMPSSA